MHVAYTTFRISINSYNWFKSIENSRCIHIFSSQKYKPGARLVFWSGFWSFFITIFMVSLNEGTQVPWQLAETRVAWSRAWELHKQLLLLMVQKSGEKTTRNGCFWNLVNNGISTTNLNWWTISEPSTVLTPLTMLWSFFCWGHPTFWRAQARNTVCLGLFHCFCGGLWAANFFVICWLTFLSKIYRILYEKLAFKYRVRVKVTMKCLMTLWILRLLNLDTNLSRIHLDIGCFIFFGPTSSDKLALWNWRCFSSDTRLVDVEKPRFVIVPVRCLRWRKR